MTPKSEMRAAIEAILFVSSDPIPRAKLLELFDEDDRELAGEALEEVLERFGAPESGIMVDEAAGGIRLVTRPELSGWLRKLFESRGGSKLSMAALETLAIVAYRQPITAPEIQELRGVSPSGVLKTLLDRHLVRVAGRREVVGKPFLYTTTREFLVHFGLHSLDDLPPLEEAEEAFGEGGTGDGESLEGPDAEERFEREAARIREADEEADEEAENGEAKNDASEAADDGRAVSRASAADPPATDPPADAPPTDPVPPPDESPASEPVPTEESP